MSPTEISVPSANCPWCLNEALARLRELPGVTEVASSLADECIYVTHPGVDVSEVLGTLRATLRAASVDRESAMLRVVPVRLAGHCRHGRERRAIDPRVIDRERGLMETMTEATARLRADGYRSDFSATAEGQLRCHACGAIADPGAITVHEIVRFEGESNPDDEAILVALQCECGHRGQYSAAFGPDTPPEDAAALGRLRHPT